MKNESPQPEFKYLAIKNWRKFQTIEDGKPAEYVKDYCDKDADLERTKLSVFQAGILDRMHRLHGRTGRMLHNDIAWLIQAIHIPRKDAPHVQHAVDALIERKFVIPTNDENFEASAATEKSREEKSREEPLEKRERRGSAPESGAGSPLPSGEKDNPSKPSDRKQDQNQPQPRKPCACADGLCEWSEPISGCSNPVRLGDCIYYQRHIKKNDYFIKKLSRGYVLEQWKRVVSDTPEDYVYDLDPLWGKKRSHDTETGGTTEQTVLRRKPKNQNEREEIRVKMPHMPKIAVEALFKSPCPYGCDKGYVEVSNYPDDPVLKRLTSSEPCRCLDE